MVLISGKNLKKDKPSNCKIPCNIGHVVGGNAICDLFCKKYQMLCNCVSYRHDCLDEIKSKMDALVKKKYVLRVIVTTLILLRYNSLPCGTEC